MLTHERACNKPGSFGTAEIGEIAARLAEGVKMVAQADGAEVRLLDECGTHLTVVAVVGTPTTSRQRDPIPTDSGFLDSQALLGRPAIVAEASSHSRPADLPVGVRSALCVPLMHDGIALGTCRAYATAPRRFCEQDAVQLMPLADLAGTAVGAIRARQKLESQEAGQASFIRVATHELRSPVAVAQSLVRGVLKGYAGDMTDKQSDMFGRISRRLDFLENLVNDLLDLAAAGASESAEEGAVVVVNHSLRRVVLLLQPRAEEKGVALDLHQRDEQMVVRGTEDGLDRVFVNLVGNGIKYTPSGGRVAVSMDQTGDEARVSVVDTGIGIPEESVPHVFEEFYRAPNAKTQNEAGTGLGLAIVRNLVDRYGGRISVKSAIGHGSAFTVVFPLLRLD